MESSFTLPQLPPPLAQQVCAILFQILWDTYERRVPQVGRIKQALKKRNEVWHQDHVAFRTFPGPHCSSATLQSLFSCLGYRRRDSYQFTQKHIQAFWLQPPFSEGQSMTEIFPKIFVSELQAQSFSAPFQEVVSRCSLSSNPHLLYEVYSLSNKIIYEFNRSQNSQLVTSLSLALAEACAGVLARAPWPVVSKQDYQTLLAESEYAAWTALFGPQANHFTVSVFLMKAFNSLADFCDFITHELNIELNTSGGVIKGSRDLKLEQAATLAEPLACLLAEDQMIQAPYAFVEFAFRHALDAQRGLQLHDWSSVYQGFVTSNADKIFESTHTQVPENQG